MDKDELINEINKTKEHLANMEKMLVECEYERWKPKEDETYYSISEIGSIIETDTRLGTITETITKAREAFCNVFQTREEAEQEAEKILVRRQLEDIARRLNRGQKFDWDSAEQTKYCIVLTYNGIITNSSFTNKIQGTVYCLDESFEDIATQEIGKERLKKYLRGE